jgi:hypothetical protein
MHALFAFAIVCLAGLAAPSNALTADVSVEKVIGNLMSPCALAVRPGGRESSQVFVAECGARRVVKLTGNKTDSSVEVIAGFAPQSSDNRSGDKPGAAGIQSLYFLDHTRLVVAGGDDEGKPFIRLYEIGDTTPPLTADDFKQEVEFPSEDRAASIRSFHDLARTRPNDKVADVLVAAARGERRPAGLWKVAVRANTLGDIAPLTDAKSSAEREVVGGTAIADSGYVVIASGTKDSPPTALTFINPVDGRAVFQINTGLERIVALAYSPTTGNLFTADAPLLGKSGGIYRLDDASELGKPACKAIKVTDIARPIALAFADDGTLYVTALGENGDKGSLWKITGEL